LEWTDFLTFEFSLPTSEFRFVSDFDIRISDLICPSIKRRTNMQRTLVIGYGNLDRGDDGAAFHVVNRLRERLGHRPLPEDDSGLETLEAETAVFVPQLTPELAVDAAPYQRLVLVDAHVTAEVRPVVYLRLQPEYRLPVVSHVLSPAMFLWLVQAVSGRACTAFLVSLRGHCFALQRGLSPETSVWVNPAVDRVLKLIDTAPAQRM
jgi:hydrogenase maturation protease